MYRISRDNLIYALAPENAPVLKVPSGSKLVFETRDCFEDQIRSVDTPFNELDWNRINPATGPVYIEGAEPGDTLAVSIEQITFGDQSVMVTGPDMGVIGDELKENEIRLIPIKQGKAIFNSKIAIPLNPMIGVIGTAPAKDSVPCGVPGSHGGNMDCNLIGAGTTLYLPVNVPGALLALGDLHAAMGDGEVSVCGAEVAGEVTLTVTVLKDKQWKLPAAETSEVIFTIASAKLLDDAAAQATRNMVKLLETDYGFSAYGAISLISLAGNVRICQIVDPQKTVRCELPKALLRK
ncbi:MAG TPA: acetamidase/formamidase family protein [Desulfobacteria bacterium]|nr:acetamidase/formamidase family protein [Desulfobacteria bacterium]